MGVEYPGQGGLTPRLTRPGRSSLVLRRGQWQQPRFSVLSPASSQHKAAPTGGALGRRLGGLPTDPPLPCRCLRPQPLRAAQQWGQGSIGLQRDGYLGLSPPHIGIHVELMLPCLQQLP